MELSINCVKAKQNKELSSTRLRVLPGQTDEQMTEEVEVKEMIKKKDMESNLRQGRRLVTNEKVNSRLMDLLFYEVEEL